MRRAYLMKQLEAKVNVLTEHTELDTAIIKHYEMLICHYQRRPSLYKSILKLDRFMVVLAMLCHYHTEKLPSLSRVRAFCERRGYLSKNSLESYFVFFTTAGYMNVSVHPDDSRLRIYQPSTLAMAEANKIIGAYCQPVAGLYEKHCKTSPVIDSETLRAFFKGFNEMLQARLTVDMLMPDSRWLMNKDGGHMLMLTLYADACKHPPGLGGYKVSTYAELSSRLSVSSTHLIRLVKEGEKLGYFQTHKNRVEVSESFMILVRKLMVLSFAVTLTCLETGRVDTEG